MACNADNGGCSQLCKALPEGKQTYARRGGGGGGLNEVFYGETPSQGLTPYPFIYHF